MRHALCGLLLIAATTALSAQDAPSDGDAGLQTIPVDGEVAVEPAEPPVQLDDIVVTATKRERSVREIPGAVHVLDGAELENARARELKDFVAQVPGLSLQEGLLRNSQRTLSIRGVGPGERANATVGMLIGDVPVTDPHQTFVMPDLDPFDLRGVEVLKGPQGTVFGGAALNGAVRYVLNTPELDAWSGRAFVDALDVAEGARGTSFGGALNAPIGESAAVRGVAVVQQIAGVYDNRARQTPDADGGEKWMGRALARWDATDRLGVNIYYLRQESGFDDASHADNRDGRLEHSYHPGPSRLDMDFGLASMELRYAFDWATLVSQTARLDKGGLLDVDFSEQLESPADSESMRARGGGDIRSHVQELRLVSPDEGHWRWIGGLYVQDYRANTDFNFLVANTEPLPGFSLVRLRQQPLVVHEYAAFGELTRRLGARWEAAAGARAYRTRIDADVEVSGATALTGGQSVRRSQYRQREDGINPKMSLSFQASDDVLAYAAVARGFQFGGVNTVPPANPGHTIPPSYDSSELWSYETGVRTDWLRRTLRADLTLFYIDWDDAQIVQTTQSTPRTTHIVNVGAVRSQGAEGALAWLLPIAGLSLGASASWVDARTTEPYTTSSTTPDRSNTVVPAGTTMPATPRLHAATTLAFNRLFGSWTAGVALAHAYVGKAWSNIQHDHEVYDYELLNLHVTAGLPNMAAAPELVLGITNLTDERGLVGRTGSDQPPAVPALASYYNRPRTISLTLRAQF